MEELKNQTCPACHKNELTLFEDEKALSGKGKVYVLGLRCDACELEQGDVELEKPGDKKFEILVKNAEDLKRSVVRSANAKLKIKELKLKLPASDGTKGYVGSVSDIVSEFMEFMKAEKELEEDKKKRKKLFNIIDELLDVEEGKKEVTIEVEDKSGNSCLV